MQNISVRKKLLIANFLMVFVPVVLLSFIGGIAFIGLKHSDTLRYKLLMLISPENSPIFATQYFLGELKINIERNHLHRIINICKLFEEQGIKTAIIQHNEILYLTEGINLNLLERMTHHRIGMTKAAEFWTERNFVFRYTSPINDITVIATSDREFFRRGEIQDNTFKSTAEIILYTIIILTITLIVMLGRYLSKLLAEQITHYEDNRKELIAGISHDLKTPLTSLKGYINGLKDGIIKTEEKRQHYLEMMNETADNMTDLVESLLMFSKLDLGRIEFHTQAVDISKYFADFVEEKRNIFAERGLNLKLTAEEVSKVLIDYVQFSRVVDNLLTNSLKYKKGEEVNVEIKIESKSDSVKISFIDDGSGVDENDLPKLFDSFYRADKARSNVSQGSGLGLAVVKQIIITLKGEVRAKNTLNGGLTIEIELPKVKGDINEEDINH